MADSSDAYRRLRFLATTYAFVVPVRGMVSNRRQATLRTKQELDAGLRRIKGWFDQVLDLVQVGEDDVRLELVREYRRVAPGGVRAWQQQTHGVGELGLARLLGHVGHPIHATPYRWEGDDAGRRLVAAAPFDRTVRNLWAYCGHGDAGRQRQRSMTAEELWAVGHPVARRVVRWMAEGCQRQVQLEWRPASPYRAVYDDARQSY